MASAVAPSRPAPQSSRHSETLVSRPWYVRIMARHAAPHSRGLICRRTGTRRRRNMFGFDLSPLRMQNGRDPLGAGAHPDAIELRERSPRRSCHARKNDGHRMVNAPIESPAKCLRAGHSRLHDGDRAGQLRHRSTGRKVEDLTRSKLGPLFRREDGDDPKVTLLIERPRRPRSVIGNLKKERRRSPGEEDAEESPEAKERRGRAERAHNSARSRLRMTLERLGPEDRPAVIDDGIWNAGIHTSLGYPTSSAACAEARGTAPPFREAGRSPLLAFVSRRREGSSRRTSRCTSRPSSRGG